MNKNKLFKAVGITILAYIIISWVLPLLIDIFGGEAPTVQVGLVSTFLVFIETFSGFGNIFVYIILIGVFYSILKASGVYDSLIEKIVAKFKGHEKLVLILTIVLFAILSSISGMDLGFLMIFPFVISIILGLGYDKIVALTSTFGATVIGVYGATYAGTYYGITNTVLGTTATSEIISKVVLLVLGLGLLIGYVLLYIKNNKPKKAVKTVKKASEKEEKVVKTKPKKSKKVLTWPILLVFGLLIVLYFVGTTTWANIFGSNWFTTAHDAVMGAKIGEFDIFNKLFGGVAALGTWNTPYRFQYYSVLLLSASLIITLVYKVKREDLVDAIVEGIKEYIVPALLTILALSLFVFSYYYPILQTIQTWILGLSKELNVATASIYSIISSICYPDFYYYAYYAIGSMGTAYATSASVVEIIATSIYGIVMLIAPTSVLLLTSLSLTDVSYKEWFKYIWKLLLALLVVALIVFIIIMAI